MKQSGSARFLTVLAIAGLAASSLTKAQGTSQSPLAFANADKNHDGFLSRSEVPEELHDLRAHFDQYDANHDHRLSVQEYSGYLSAMVYSACTGVQNAMNPNCHSAGGVGGAQYTPPPPPPQTKPSGH